MKKKKNQIGGRNPDPRLRDEAEGKLAGFSGVPDGIQEKTLEEVIHELQIHQIELEMQNEELRMTQVALEESRARYSDLYDFAPVGYFTFTPEALIKEVNLTGSTLLGVARQKLINTRFRKIVTAKDQDLWDQHFLKVLREGEKQTCDLILKRPEGSPFYAGLESIRREVGRGAFLVHTTITDITERKRLEAVIRQSEERYRTAIIEEINEGYYEVDLAGNFTFVNDSITRLLLYSREELIGMNYRAYFPREEVDEAYKTFNRVYRTGEIIKNYPVTNIRKDGTTIFTEDSISCRRDKEGRIIGFRGICRDVSERKRAEQALKESEIRFRNIFETSEDGIVFFDGKTRKIILANKAMVRLLKCPPEGLIGRSIPFWDSSQEIEFQKHLNREINVSKGVPLLCNDGSVSFVDISSSHITLEGKIYISSFFHDITERKQAEEALKRSEGKYRLIAENMADIIAVLDMNLRFTYVSPSIRRIRGFSVEEAMEQTLEQVLTPESQKIVLTAFEEEMKLEASGTADPDRVRSLEVEEYRKDGSSIWMEVNFSFLRDENQKAVGILSVSRDISKRKQAEEANKISLTKYQTLFESLPLGVTVSDMAGNILESNREADKLLGLPRGEQTQRTIDRLEWPIVRPDGSPMPAEEYAGVRALKRNGLVENVEMGIVKGEGQVTWINMTAAPIPLPDYGVVIVYSDITENKRIEKALQESEDQYRDLVESSRDLMCIHDLTGKILWVNQEPIRILGYDKDFILGMNIRDFLASDRKDEFDEYLATIRSQGVASGLLKTYTAKGEKRIWEYHNTLRTEGVAEPIIRGMAHDITERRLAEEMMKASEEKYRIIFDEAPMGIAITTIEGKIIELNKAQAEMIGGKTEELKGGNVNEYYLYPDKRREMIELFKKTGKVRDFEMEIKKKDGLIINELLNLDHVKIGDKDYLFATGRDITKRKKAEEGLKKAEEKYRNIFENAIEGIFQTTPDGRLLVANAALAHMLGYHSPEELIRSITDIENQIYADPDRRAELRRLLESRDKVEGFENPVYRKDGQVIWNSINIRAVRNEKEELLFYEGTAIDITEKKRLQTEIMQADRLSSIGELAAGVAHEINNPINGIINYAQMLIDQTQDPGGENDIPQRIIKEGERIASIVNNLLKFSKDRRENLRPIPIQTPLNGVLDLVGTQMKKEGIRISVKFPPDLPQVLINSQQIQQVFLNLLSNTRYALNQKYPGDHPEKTLTISGKKIISGQGLPQIRLNFRDAGTGIPKAFLDKIFTPFFTTKLAEKGTGLGLSISRKIIQDHGGRLWLESREGKYTNAIVELPAAEEK